MPMPSVYAVGAVASSVNAITPGAPAGTQENDILILVTSTANQNYPTDPPSNGWQNLPANIPTGFGTAGGVGALRLKAYWQRVGSGGFTAASIGDSGNYQIGRIIGVRGCRTSGSPWDTNTATNNQTSAATTVTWTGITTTEPDCLIIGLLGGDRDANSTTDLGNPSNANLANITTHVENWTNVGNGGGIAAWTGERASAGAIGNSTASITSQTFSWWIGALVGEPAQNFTATPTDSSTVTDSLTFLKLRAITSNAQLQFQDDFNRSDGVYDRFLDTAYKPTERFQILGNRLTSGSGLVGDRETVKFIPLASLCSEYRIKFKAYGYTGDQYLAFELSNSNYSIIPGSELRLIGFSLDNSGIRLATTKPTYTSQAFYNHGAAFDGEEITLEYISGVAKAYVNGSEVLSWTDSSPITDLKYIISYFYYESTLTRSYIDDLEIYNLSVPSYDIVTISDFLTYEFIDGSRYFTDTSAVLDYLTYQLIVPNPMVLRNVKGTPLTHNEIDSNLTYLNTKKSNNSIAILDITSSSEIPVPAFDNIDGKKVILKITSSDVYDITWNSIYRTVGETLPTQTDPGKVFQIFLAYNAADNKWDVISVIGG
jgi:hypothetical protein